MGEAKRRRQKAGLKDWGDPQVRTFLSEECAIKIVGVHQVAAAMIQLSWEDIQEPRRRPHRMAFQMFSRIESGEIRPWRCLLCDRAYVGIKQLQSFAVVEHDQEPPNKDKPAIVAPLCQTCITDDVWSIGQRVCRALGFRDVKVGQPPKPSKVLDEYWTTNVLGERVFVRKTDATPSDVMASMQDVAGGSAAKVPCQGCRECCWHHRVDVYPGLEPTEGLDVVHTASGYSLRKRADGACVHLGEGGCTVYDRRPLACRSYDCRIASLVNQLDAFDNGHASPGWSFAMESEEDEIIARSGWLIGLAGVLQAKKGGVAKNYQDLMLLLVELIPKMRRVKATLDAMPADERAAFDAEAQSRGDRAFAELGIDFAALRKERRNG